MGEEGETAKEGEFWAGVRALIVLASVNGLLIWP